MDDDEDFLNEIPIEPLIPGLHSVNHQATSFVNFKNLTQSEVDVVWIDYQGFPVVYATLLPFQNLKLKTFETHPWIFRDKNTHEKYQVNSKDIFLPKSFETIIRNSIHPVVGAVSPFIVTHYIHYPLYNLKERASQVVQKCLSDPKLAYHLDIPSTLKSYVAETKFRH